MFNYTPNSMGYNNPMNYNPSYTPYDMPRTYPTAQGNTLVRVNGIEGAKAYQMAIPNSTVALFDENDALFYVKTTDGACFPTIRIFRFEEVKDTEQPKQEYVSRKEMEEYVKSIISKSNEQTRAVNAISESAKAE